MFRVFTRVSVWLVVGCVISVLGARLMAPALPYEGEIVYSTYGVNTLPGVYLLDIARRKEHRFHSSSGRFHWSANGEDLLLSYDFLVPPITNEQLVRFDFSSPRVQPFLPMTEGVYTYVRELGVKLSPDGRSLVYAAFSAPEFVWIDPTGSERRYPIEGRNLATFMWMSNDRLRYAYIHPLGRWNNELVVIDLHSDGTSNRVGSLFFNDTYEPQPQFSPDGSRLLVWHSNMPANRYQLQLVNLSSWGSRIMGSSSQWSSDETAWSPDGQQFVYILNDENFTDNLVLVSAADRHAESLFTAARDQRIGRIEWSLDGTQLAFTLWSGYVGETLCLLALEDHNVTCSVQSSTPVAHFAWRPR